MQFDGKTPINAYEQSEEPEDMSQARSRIYHLAAAYNEAIAARKDTRLGAFAALGVATGLLVVCGFFLYQNIELSQAYHDLLFNGR